MENQDLIIKLKTYKNLINNWEKQPSKSLREEINKLTPQVKKIVVEAHCAKYMSAFPPMGHGVMLDNFDPFDFIFNPPYGESVVPFISDFIDQTIGVIESGNYMNEVKDSVTNLSKTSKTLPSSKCEETTSKRIFLVHGKNNELKETVARFLEKLGLQLIILNEQINFGDAIIEKFESYSDVGYAVILMSPDDIGYENGKEDSKKGRARQNVIFEFGYFVGKMGRSKTCVIMKGDVETPTDVSGIVYLSFDHSESWKLALAKEIKASGIEIDLNKL